jgi:hypothetical protein
VPTNDEFGWRTDLCGVWDVLQRRDFCGDAAAAGGFCAEADRFGTETEEAPSRFVSCAAVSGA